MFYRLGELVYEGVFCQTFVGYAKSELGIERKVIIKRLRKELADDSVAVEKFSREAKLLSKLYHPGVVSIIEFAFVEDVPAVVLEFAEGKTVWELAKTLPAESPQRQQLARQLVSDVAHTMFDISERMDSTFVHGDISAANLLFASSTGMVVLLDFGEAFFADAPPRQRELYATAPFAAPELATDGYSVAADIYALGKCASLLCPNPTGELASLLEAMTRQSPRERPNGWEDVLNLLGEPPMLEFSYASTKRIESRPKANRSTPKDSFLRTIKHDRIFRQAFLRKAVAGVVVLALLGWFVYSLFEPEPLPLTSGKALYEPSRFEPTLSVLRLWALPSSVKYVSIDGKESVVSALPVFELSAGLHLVELQDAEGAPLWQKKILLAPAEVKIVRFSKKDWQKR